MQTLTERELSADGTNLLRGLDGLALPISCTNGTLEMSDLPTVFGDFALLFVFAFFLEHVGGGAGPSKASSASAVVGA